MLADLQGTIILLHEEGVRLPYDSGAVGQKKAKVKRYMDYSRELGALHK